MHGCKGWCRHSWKAATVHQERSLGTRRRRVIGFPRPSFYVSMPRTAWSSQNVKWIYVCTSCSYFCCHWVLLFEFSTDVHKDWAQKSKFTVIRGPHRLITDVIVESRPVRRLVDHQDPDLRTGLCCYDSQGDVLSWPHQGVAPAERYLPVTGQSVRFTLVTTGSINPCCALSHLVF